MTLRNAVRKAKAETGLRRDMKFAPTTLDTDARTVEVIAATETPVDRIFGREILVCDATAVMPRRLHLLPVLDSHRGESVLNILGTVVAHRFEGRKLVMNLRFADTPAGNAAMAMVADGTLTSVSIGYRVLKAEEVAGRRGDVPTVNVTKWEPVEISFVAVPADPTALVRGKTDMAIRPKKTNRNAPRVIDDLNPDDDIDTRLGSDDDDNDDTSDLRQRTFSTRDMSDVMTLRDLAVRSGVNESDFTVIMERSGGNMNRLRSNVLRLMAERSDDTPTDSRLGISQLDGLQGRGTEARDAIIDALAVRLGGTSKVKDNPHAGRSLIEIGRRYLEQVGFSTRGMDDVRLADILIAGRQADGISVRAGHTTSDFPLLLQGAGNRALLERFSSQVTPLKSFSRKRDVRDFRQQTFIRPGEAPLLEKVLENGAIRHGTLEEDTRGLKIDTYAKMFSISRQALINDDLGAFSEFLGAFAQASAETEGNLFAGLLLANGLQGATLGDNKPLFHADHGNYTATGSAISVDAVSEARKMMRLQKNVNGTGTAGVVPAILLVGPSQETEAEKLVASLNAATIGEVNPFTGKLRVEVENRITHDGWYLVADPAQRPVFMHGYLQGGEGPQVGMKEGWEVLGTQYRCVLDFGCAVMESRAIYFNKGPGS